MWTTVCSTSAVSVLASTGATVKFWGESEGRNEIQRGLEAMIRQHKEYHLNKKLLKEAFKSVFQSAKPKGKKKRK